MQPGKIHVRGDALSRAPHIAFNAVEIPFIELDSVIGSYENDQFFGPIVQAINGKEIEDPVKTNQVANLMPLFERDGKTLLYEGKLCIPKTSVAPILQMAHDARLVVIFGFSKTLSRLEMYHWRHKTRDVKRYVAGCLVCQ